MSQEPNGKVSEQIPNTEVVAKAKRRVAPLSGSPLALFFALPGSLEALYVLFRSVPAAQAAFSQLLGSCVSICLAYAFSHSPIRVCIIFSRDSFVDKGPDRI